MNKLCIKRFKCFKDIEISLNQLTVLVGSNGVGKSSAIQSILLLKQAIDCKKSGKIYLNDVYDQNLGIGNSVCNKELEDTSFEITINNPNDEKSSHAIFNGDEVGINFMMDISNVKSGDLGDKNFHYLSAERIGPRISQPLVHMDYLNVGIHGENTAQVIGHNSGRTHVDDNRMLPESKNKTLESQVNCWINTIFPNVKIRAKISSETLTSQILVENEYAKDNFSTNIGFGISYVLPVITTCLIASRGSYVIIENPEAHLHPAAQAAMGKFLARMSQAGLNIIIETHSDHILEGIQLFVAQNKEWSKNVSVISFAVNKEQKQPKVQEIHFNEKAEFSSWPDGFMDQSQKDFVELQKLRAKA